MAGEKLLDLETIKAAVAGKKWAVQKVIEHYSDEIDRESTVNVEQPDGSIKKELDEDLRQAIILKLIEAIPQFPLSNGQYKE